MQKKLWSKEFVAVIAVTFFNSWAFFALLPTLPIYLLETLGMSHSNVGLIIAAFSLSIIVIRPVAGYLVDNFHRFGVFILSVSVITVGYGIYPLACTFSSMLLLRFVHGAMWGIYTSSNATLVGDIVPPSQLGQAIGIYALSIPVGMTVGPMFGLQLLKNQGPNGMFLAILGISFIALLGAVCARTPSSPIIRKKFSLPNLFHKKAFPISLCMCFIMIAYGAIIIFVSIYAGQRNLHNVPKYFICFSSTIFLSRLFDGRLFDRGHIFSLILIGLVLTAVGMVWLGCAADSTQFLVAGLINGFGFGTLMPTCQAAVNTLVKSGERGAANSTYLFSYDLGIGLGSLIPSFLLDKVSLAEIYRYSVILVLIAAGIFLFMAIPHYSRNR